MVRVQEGMLAVRFWCFACNHWSFSRIPEGVHGVGSFDPVDPSQKWERPRIFRRGERLSLKWLRWTRNPASDAREDCNIMRWHERRDEKRSGRID